MIFRINHGTDVTALDSMYVKICLDPSCTVVYHLTPDEISGEIRGVGENKDRTLIPHEVMLEAVYDLEPSSLLEIDEDEGAVGSIEFSLDGEVVYNPVSSIAVQVPVTDAGVVVYEFSKWALVIHRDDLSEPELSSGVGVVAMTHRQAVNALFVSQEDTEECPDSLGLSLGNL